jgi:predicted transcriptional regulator|tara:strand:- start:324 stop:551 length:228 start_codon:yes stop_codon:yes gene_type:complete
MKDTILTPNKFALIVENMVKEQRISYIDAILEYCKDNNIDPSNTKAMISKTLKEKIAYEAQNLNMLKEKVAKLPI